MFFVTAGQPHSYGPQRAGSVHPPHPAFSHSEGEKMLKLIGNVFLIGCWVDDGRKVSQPLSIPDGQMLDSGCRHAYGVWFWVEFMRCLYKTSAEFLKRSDRASYKVLNQRPILSEFLQFCGYKLYPLFIRAHRLLVFYALYFKT